VVPVTQDNNKLYCPKCKHAWDKKNLPKEGSLTFDGIPQAKMFIDLIMKNDDIAPPNKAGLVAQLVGTFYDQWFEGFKAGLIADIVYKLDREKENGKDSTGQQRKDGEHRSGDQESSVSNDQDSSPRGSLSDASGRITRIKELVAGIEFVRPANIHLSDDFYSKVAEHLTRFPEGKVVKAETNGSTVSVTFNL
jgi:hypothetical protein